MIASPAVTEAPSRIAASAATAIRTTIRWAGGRETCFVGTLDEQRDVVTVRVVARGDARSVLALPGFANRGEILIHNHPSGVLDPSEADLEVAARLYEEGVGFAITDNDATSLYVVVEVPEAPRIAPLEMAAIDADLGPGGAVAGRLPRYEDRPSQRAMARAVGKLYNMGGVALLEAGTGVGKSLAYLVPALRWAAQNGERTVVSTNTINLQEQLVSIDLPFLRGALGDQPVRFALLKGWRNYICLLRLEQVRESGRSLFEDAQAGEIEALAQWADRTTDGSRGDLPTQPRPEIWDEVAAEPDLCQRFECRHYDRCFVFAARRAAVHADVVVVNHHVLLSDVAVRRAQQNWTEAAVIPAYTRLIVDEGHHLEEAAATHLGATVTWRGLQRLLGRLDRRGGRGLLHALEARLRTHDDLLSSASLDLLRDKLAPAARSARERSDALFELLGALVEESGQSTVRLTEEFDSHRIWGNGLNALFTDFLRDTASLHEGLRLIRERLEIDRVRAEEMGPLLAELRGVARRLEGAGDALQNSLRPAAGGAPTIRWVERRGAEQAIAAASVPLDLAPMLREDLFRRVATTVVTSATLTTDGSFAFLTDRLGLTEPDVEPSTGVFHSPFDYPEQALLVVPTDLPAPNTDEAGHWAGVLRCADALITAADGGTFVLFTSHRDVRAAAAELRASGVGGRWPLLVHGEEGRDALLRRFRDSGRAVLLGTASFWEGVDVPGRALRALLIAKLPFRVPSEPVTAAQCEAIAARGGDPFAEYMLPHAALRLKQGVGRLIRSTTDRGVILLADPRVVTKRYGSALLDALPPARRAIGPWSVVKGEIDAFFATFDE